MGGGSADKHYPLPRRHWPDAVDNADRQQVPSRACLIRQCCQCRQTGAVELSAALTAFVIGSALLTLSVFWHQMRRVVVGVLGGLKDRLPPVHTPLGPQGIPA